MTENLLEGEALKAYVGSYGTGDGTLDELLEQAGAPPCVSADPSCFKVSWRTLTGFKR